MLKHIDIYITHTIRGFVTDNAFYAYALLYNDRAKYGYGEIQKRITQNSIVLIAMKEALVRMRYPCEIKFHIDSQYIANAFHNGWTDVWKHNGYKKATGEKIVDFTRWEELLEACGMHVIEVIYSERHELSGILETGIRKGGIFEKQ